MRGSAPETPEHKTSLTALPLIASIRWLALLACLSSSPGAPASHWGSLYPAEWVSAAREWGEACPSGAVAMPDESIRTRSKGQQQAQPLQSCRGSGMTDHKCSHPAPNLGPQHCQETTESKRSTRARTATRFRGLYQNVRLCSWPTVCL